MASTAGGWLSVEGRVSDVAVDLAELLEHAARSPIRGRAMSEDVYAILLRAIATGVIAEGMSLRVDEIARALDVSPMPVREALQRLATEQLVTTRFGHSAVVKSMSNAEAIDFLFAYRALVLCAMRSGASRLSTDHRAEIRVEVDAALRAADAGDAAAALDHSFRVNDIVQQASENAELLRLISLLRPRLERLVRSRHVTIAVGKAERAQLMAIRGGGLSEILATTEAVFDQLEEMVLQER